MQSSDERLWELIAAAVAGDLNDEEHVELDEARRTHPWIDDEIASLSAVAARVAVSDVAWDDVTPDEALRRRVAGAPTTDAADEEALRHSTPVAQTSGAGRRRRWVAPLIAAACLVVGIAIGLGATALTSIPPSGPPGTLGAVEPIDLSDDLAGAHFDADIVAHTWGTETLIQATGLSVGTTYSVVLVGADGSEFSAGEMLGSTVPIDCRLNAAVLRQDVASVEIRTADGGTVATADLPAVAAPA